MAAAGVRQDAAAHQRRPQHADAQGRGAGARPYYHTKTPSQTTNNDDNNISSY